MVYDDGRVRIVAQDLAPGPYEVKMDETFTTVVADGRNKGAAVFFRID
jgi:16S rRNA G1207 methylase RsmC